SLVPRSDAEGRKTCSFDSKKARKPARSSAEVRIRELYEGGPGETYGLARVEEVSALRERGRAKPGRSCGAGNLICGRTRAPNAPSLTVGPLVVDALSAVRCSRFHLFFGGDLLPNLLQGAANEPRDVHLRDADLLRNLRLREPFEEAQVQDLPLPVVEDAEPRRQHSAVLRDVVLVLFGADRLERVELFAVLLRAAGRQRQRGVCAPGLERLEHLFFLGTRSFRELGDRRRPTELHRQLFDQSRKLHVQLLEAARDADGPALVAEVPLDLPDDVRRRVRRQLDTAVEIEAVDCLDQPDR